MSLYLKQLLLQQSKIQFILTTFGSTNDFQGMLSSTKSLEMGNVRVKGRKRFVSCTGSFTNREKAPHNHCI
jgi:predicted DNA-binding protein with PD1-like motif